MNMEQNYFEQERTEEYSFKAELKKEYWKYLSACLVYALFFVFCFYKNATGITAPFFAAATIFILAAVAKKQKIAYQKKSAVIIAAIVLFGLSNCLTVNGGIIFFNDIFAIFLVLLLIVSYLYHTDGWSFLDYFTKVMNYFAGGIGSAGDLFSNYIKYKQSHAVIEREPLLKNPQVRAALFGVLCVCPVAGIVLVMLSTSDVVFGTMLANIFISIIDYRMVGNICGMFFMAAVMFFMAYGLLSQFAKKYGREECTLYIEKQEPMAAITFTGVLLMVYMIFSGIQIGALFLGKMTLPQGYTYSRYAREGFMQLLCVCVLNFAIVMICYSFFRENKILKIILTLMTICTFIMISSAAFRMGMYVQAYGLTRKRVLVFWLLLVLFVLFLGVLAAVWNEHFPLFQYGTAVVIGMYLILSFSHMDYWIAKYDLFENTQSIMTDIEARNDTSGHWSEKTLAGKVIKRENIDYVETALSLDAAPVVFEYYRKENKMQESDRNYYFMEIEEKCKGMGIRSFNVSKYIAVTEKEKW